MATRPLSDEDALEAVRLRGLHKTIQAAAEAAGVFPSTFNNRLKRAAERGLDGSTPKPLPPGQTVRGTSALYTKDEAGAWRESAIWVKTRNEPSTEDIATAIKDAFADFSERSPVIEPPSVQDDDLATVYVCADWHVGLLSWHRETGVNFDLEIARDTIAAAATRLVSSSPSSSQAVVLGLGDLLHSDGYENQTPTSKHALDVDGRYPRVLRAATHLLIATTRLALQKHRSVLVRILPGNHDPQSAIAVALALSLYFHDNPRVTVDDDPSYFWWWSWGLVLSGATHGDQAKMKDLPLIMATRNPEAWGKAKFRYVWTGHIHTQTGIEMSGVTVESFQTPTAPDAWHSRRGYGANRSLTSITLHKEHGEIARNKVNILNG